MDIACVFGQFMYDILYRGNLPRIPFLFWKQTKFNYLDRLLWKYHGACKVLGFLIIPSNVLKSVVVGPGFFERGAERVAQGHAKTSDPCQVSCVGKQTWHLVPFIRLWSANVSIEVVINISLKKCSFYTCCKAPSSVLYATRTEHRWTTECCSYLQCLTCDIALKTVCKRLR